MKNVLAKLSSLWTSLGIKSLLKPILWIGGVLLGVIGIKVYDSRKKKQGRREILEKVETERIVRQRDFYEASEKAKEEMEILNDKLPDSWGAVDRMRRKKGKINLGEITEDETITEVLKPRK